MLFIISVKQLPFLIPHQKQGLLEITGFLSILVCPVALIHYLRSVAYLQYFLNTPGNIEK